MFNKSATLLSKRFTITPEGIMMAEKLVTITTFDMPTEAHLAKNLLAANGLAPFLADEFTVGVAWHLSNALGGIKLQVAETDAERAIAALEGPEGAVPDVKEQLRGIAEIEGAPAETPVSISDRTADRALRAALLGLLFIPLFQLYSLWMIGGLFFSGQKISKRGWRKIWVAGMLDLIVLGAIVLTMILSQ